MQQRRTLDRTPWNDPSHLDQAPDPGRRTPILTPNSIGNRPTHFNGDILAREIFALPDVSERESMISMPGARALWLNRTEGAPADSFMIGTEFAHLHPGQDQNLHLMLPPHLAIQAVETGWAGQHQVARMGRFL